MLNGLLNIQNNYYNKRHMQTRTFLKLSAAFFATTGLIGAAWLSRAGSKPSERPLGKKITMSELDNLKSNPDVIEPIKLSKEDWQARLSPAEYHVLRKAGTERPSSSHLNQEKREGEYACAGCGLSLFTSATKYESGTGWPSFYQPIANRLGESIDFKIGLPRTEYHCIRCKGHQGHVFKDGPKPTGLRYCNNGVALKFIPA